MAHPPLSFPSTSQIKLSGAFLGPKMFLSIFFLESLDFQEDQPVCHIYQWVARPTHGSVCNHCERMMDGMRLEHVISGNREGSLTEDEVVAYVQSGGPTNQAWDDWPLRMTFRINSFLRTNGPVPEPDLAILGFLDD